jgi:hypothetical protein
MKFSLPESNRNKAEPVRAASSLLLACATLLSGCASRHWMPFPARNELKQVSRTVVYLAPQHRLGVNNPPNILLRSAAGVAGELAGNFLATGFLSSPAPVVIYPVISWGPELKEYRQFRSHIKPYLPELAKLDLSAYQQRMIRKAVAQVGWPGAMPVEAMPAVRAPGYLQRITVHNQSRATVFIIPRGVRLSNDVRSLVVIYGVAAYIKEAGDSGKIRQLDSATIQTVQSIRFPLDIEAYNPLTSPTTDALADRMKMLFGNHAGFFMRAFKQALRVEQAKITCYFADSCPS